jgi:3,4-dihydroxy 2-butanone 4-phosphate synthase/GTP cyclohydrolase II
MAVHNTKSGCEANLGTSTIEEALVAMKAGKFVVVMDNEDRENEGDLIMPAEFATEESLAFMIRHTTGIVCVPALDERLEELQLSLMVENNTEAHKCKFTVTVDLKEGNTTGVSAADRARTIRALADRNVPASAFNRPGHIFPLRAMNGGVLARAGHTEAAVDLSRLAGCAPVGYICEMSDENGVMMRRPALEKFAQKYGLPLITISDLIRYRFCHEKLIQVVVSSSPSLNEQVVKTPHGNFKRCSYKSLADETQSFEVLWYGQVEGKENVLVHFVEEGLDASIQAQWAQKYIIQNGCGVIVYENNSKHLLEVSGELMARQSIFGMGVQILQDLGLVSAKILAIETFSFDTKGFGLKITGFEQLSIA